MRRTVLILCCWLALACAALAGPALELPKEAAGQPGDFVKVAAKTDGKAVRWIALDPGLNVFPVELLKDSKTAVVTAQKPGRYRLLAYTAAGDDPSDPAVCTVVIGDAPPVPPGPGPGPGPTPPGPAPPIPDAGFRVLILEETAERTKLPEAQQAAIFSVTVRQYLDTKTVASAGGRTHEWGIFDKDADLSAYSPQLQAMRQKAMADPAFKTPWLIMGDGKAGYSGPLPADTNGLMNQLKSFGERK